VPYKGGGPDMLRDMIGGHVMVASSVLSSFVNEHKRGDLRVLATAGDKRSPTFPDVPTFKEQGVDLVASPWYALFAPSGTPSDVIQKLSKAATATIQDPVIYKKLMDMELEPTGYGPDRLAQIMKADYEKWGPPIRASGFTPQ